MYPETYRYTKEHEWVWVDSGIATIGITDHAQKELGDIVYVDLPKPGAICTATKAFGSVESVKAVSDVYSPVSGEVVEVNDALTGAPERVNEEPHGGGWLIKVRLSAAEELGGLMTAADYKSYLGES